MPANRHFLRIPESLLFKEGLALRVGQRLKTRRKFASLPSRPSTSLKGRGSMWSPRRSAVKVAGKETIGVGLSGAAKLGDRFWGQNGPFERARGSGNRWLRAAS